VGKKLHTGPLEGAKVRDVWNGFVRAAGGSLFHSWEWWELIERATGEKPLRLGAWEGSRLVGVACVLDRKRLGWRLGVNPLLTPWAGLLLAPSGRSKTRSARREAQRRHDVLLAALQERLAVIHLQTAGDDMRDYLARGFRVSPRYTYAADLDNIESLWERLDGAARRQIEKARRGAVEKIAEGAAWEEVASLVEGAFRRRGRSCPISRPLIREIVEAPEFANRRLIVCARDDAGDALSAAVSLWDADGRIAYYVLAATRPDALSSGAASGVLWETLKRLAANRKARVYDFCGANDESVARFKEGFSPRLIQQHEIEWEGSALAGLARRLWGLRSAWERRRSRARDDEEKDEG
jgi:hypothetical protein